MGQWRRYRKEKDGILATECIGMTCLLQRVQMYGFNLTGTKSANLFCNHCLLHLLSYDNGIGLERHFLDTNDEWGSLLI
jgi:hypothetical protein